MYIYYNMHYIFVNIFIYIFIYYYYSYKIKDIYHYLLFSGRLAGDPAGDLSNSTCTYHNLLDLVSIHLHLLYLQDPSIKHTMQYTQYKAAHQYRLLILLLLLVNWVRATPDRPFMRYSKANEC
jgi:hypothetical protein